MHSNSRLGTILAALGLLSLSLVACSQRPAITAIEQLGGKEFAVPTGTVDLMMTVTGPVAFAATSRATWNTPERSAEPSAAEGVPTAMNTTRASASAPST